MGHENSGHCEKCVEIIMKYGDPYEELVDWFFDTQKQLPYLHVSECGRDKKRQELMFKENKSRAHWTESAHNYSCALDMFKNDKGNLYDQDWFRGVFSKHVPTWLNWYGRPGSKFYELPHIEPFNWKQLIDEGIIKLIGTEKP